MDVLRSTKARSKKMNDINTANLIEQMRMMIAQAEGRKIEGSSDSEGGSGSFGAVFQNALNQVNEANNHSVDLTNRYELGDPNVSLADVMVETQKASLGFQGALMVRNKIVQAYQDIMNMPV
jgi:flagellar hook-basal body complex protein FliE